MFSKPFYFKFITSLIVAVFCIENFAYSLEVGGKNLSSQSPNQPSVWLIEDIHSSLGGQIQIAQIVQTILENEPKSLIGIEGASGEPEISFLKSFPDTEIRKNAAFELLRESKISAAEYAAITTEAEVEIRGVEDPRLYSHNWKVYARLKREGVQLNPQIQKFSKMVSAMENETLSSGVIRWMNALDRPETTTGKEFFEDLKQALHKLEGTGFSAPRFSVLFEKNILPEGVLAEDVADEIQRLSERMLLLEASSTDELRALESVRRLRRIERVMALEASREDVFRIASLENPNHFLSESEFKSLQARLKACLCFYEGVVAREKPMAENLLAQMRRRKSPEAVLVVGGFHTAGLVNDLRLRGLNVTVLRPKLEKLDSKRLYEFRALNSQSRRAIQARMTEMLYAMFGAAVFNGYDLNLLKKQYLGLLDQNESSKKIIEINPIGNSKIYSQNHGPSTVSAPTVLTRRFLPGAEAVSSIQLVSMSPDGVRLDTPLGARLVTRQPDGGILMAAAGALILALPACSIQSAKETQTPPKSELSLPSLSKNFDSAVPTEDDLYQVARRMTSEISIINGRSAVSRTADIIPVEDYGKLPRIQIMSPVSKMDSCPLCNEMTYKELEKLQNSGAIGKIEAYEDTDFKPSALAVLKDRSRPWAERYVAMMHLIFNRKAEGILTAHEMLRPDSGNDPYGFWNREGVRILRALAAQWLVMIGPNQADIQILIQYGLSDPDDLVRFMSAEALRKAALADQANIFSEALRKDAAIRIAQMTQEDPSLFARYAAYLALPKIAGADRATSFVRYGLENEKDYYVLKAVLQSALANPTESYTEGLLELLKRQPPEKTPALVRSYEEQKQQARQVLIQLLSTKEFHDGVNNAILRKIAQNDMYTVTVGMKGALHQYAMVLIESDGPEKTAINLRSWIEEGRNLPIKKFNPEDPALSVISDWDKEDDRASLALKASDAKQFERVIQNIFRLDEATKGKNARLQKWYLDIAYAGELALSSGIETNYRVLAINFIGRKKVISASDYLIAAAKDPNKAIRVAALKNLRRIWKWEMQSGFAALDGEFAGNLTQFLTLGLDGKMTLSSNYVNFLPNATLVSLNWSDEEKKLASELLRLVQGDGARLAHRKPFALASLLSLATVVIIPSCASAPWEPISPKPARQIPEQFKPGKILLSVDDLWPFIEKNLNVKLSGLDVWRQEAAQGRLEPGWAIEITGGFEGNKPVVSSAVSYMTPSGAINLSAIYGSNGLSLAADFAGALLRKLLGADEEARLIQSQLVLASFHRLQETVLAQKNQAADLLIELNLTRQKIKILEGRQVSLKRLTQLAVPANQKARQKAQREIPALQADILQLHIEANELESKILMLLSGSPLDQGKEISVSLDFETSFNNAVAILRRGNIAFQEAAAANPAILAAERDYEAAQHAYSFAERTQRASLNIGAFWGTNPRPSDMPGPFFHELAGRPLESYGAVSREQTFQLKVPFGAPLEADLALAQANVKEAELRVQIARSEFAAAYNQAFISMHLLVKELERLDQSLEQFQKIFPGGVWRSPNESLESQMENEQKIGELLMRIEDAKLKIFKTAQTLNRLGANPYPWETKPRGAMKTDKDSKGARLTRLLKILDLEKNLSNWPVFVPLPIEAAGQRRVNIVDASLLETRELTRLVSGMPSAYWLILLDPGPNSQKEALKSSLEALPKFQGQLIESASPYRDTIDILEKLGDNTFCIAAGMDSRVKTLPAEKVALRLEAGFQFWMSQVRTPEDRLEVLKLVFGSNPPKEMLNGYYDLKKYLRSAFGYWQSILAYQQLAASA